MTMSDHRSSPFDAAPSTAIVSEIARLEGMEPTEIEPPLYEVLDPDALDALFTSTGAQPPREGGYVLFTYRDYEVTVYGSGRIDIREDEANVGTDAPLSADSQSTVD